MFELSFYLIPAASTHEHTFVNGSCSCGATDPNYVPPSTPSTPGNPGGTVTPPATGSDKVASFEFGDNGSGQTDGTEITANKTYTDGSYTLTLTGLTKVYGGARDEAGNSCLKLGTSNTAGSFSFTVGTDIAKVVIRAGAYKQNTNYKLIVNGTTYTLPNGNGEYMEIEVDTSSNKTVTVETTGSKSRAEIDSIAYYVASTTPSDPGNTDTPSNPGNTDTPSNPGNTDTPSNPGNTNTDVNQGGSNAPTTGGDQGTSTLPQEKDNTVLIIIVIVVCVLVLGASAVTFVIVYKKTKSKVE